MELAAAAEVKVNALTNLAYVRGRGRLPSDVGSELLDVLGDVCRMVVCDLTGLAAAGTSSVVEALTPAACYLRTWRGTTLILYVSDTAMRHALLRSLVSERVLVPSSLITGTVEARAGAPRLRSVTALLPPWPSAVVQARRIAVRTLGDWQVEGLTDATALVTTELVTNAVLHAQTPLQLTMVSADGQVRLAVRDRGGGLTASHPEHPDDTSLHGRGLLLVDAYTSGWGTLPARRSGKTVWAVLDTVPKLASLGRPA